MAGAIVPTLSAADILRFWGHVNKHGPLPSDPTLGNCWIWTAGLSNGNRYGNFSIQDKTYSAHRIAWLISNGLVPPGLFVLHKCDRKECCNPAHLFLGTHGDNMLDMAAKGRAAQGDGHGSRIHPGSLPRGEDNSASKLTAEKVREIRRLSASGVGQHKIGLKFGVTKRAVQQILRGITWRHVH